MDGLILAGAGRKQRRGVSGKPPSPGVLCVAYAL